MNKGHYGDILLTNDMQLNNIKLIFKMVAVDYETEAEASNYIIYFLNMSYVRWLLRMCMCKNFVSNAHFRFRI